MRSGMQPKLLLNLPKPSICLRYYFSGNIYSVSVQIVQLSGK